MCHRNMEDICTSVRNDTDLCTYGPCGLATACTEQDTDGLCLRLLPLHPAQSLAGSHVPGFRPEADLERAVDVQRSHDEAPRAATADLVRQHDEVKVRLLRVGLSQAGLRARGTTQNNNAGATL